MKKFLQKGTSSYNPQSFNITLQKAINLFLVNSFEWCHQTICMYEIQMSKLNLSLCHTLHIKYIS